VDGSIVENVHVITPFAPPVVVHRLVEVVTVGEAEVGELLGTTARR